MKWKHFPRYWTFFVRGIHPSSVNSTHKGQWRGALTFSLICAWINGWIDNRRAGDLRRHHAHYDVTVFLYQSRYDVFWYSFIGWIHNLANIGFIIEKKPLWWHHNGRDSVSNHQPHDCFPNRLFRRRSKKTSKLRVTGLCAGNSPGTGEFSVQMASNAENVSIWRRHHELRMIPIGNYRTKNTSWYFADPSWGNQHINVESVSMSCCHHAYRQVSDVRRTKSQHLKDSRTVLRLSLPNPSKPDVKSIMKMQLEQRRQAML